MKLRISDSSLSALAVLGITARVLSGIVIDCPELYNSGWISVLIGALFALPLAFLAIQMRKRAVSEKVPSLFCALPAPAARILAALLCAAAMLDASFTSVGIANSASYVTLNTVTTFYLLVPLFLLCLWCLPFNGNALGSGARIWIKILLIILLIVVLAQLPQFRPSWLTPILGPGIPDILTGALRVAGWYSLLTGAFLLTERDSEGGHGFHPLKMILLSAAATIVLLLLRAMLTPAQTKTEVGSRFFQLSTLLSNGRPSISLELPLVVMWFVGLLFELLFEAFLCAALLQQALPRLPRMACIALTITAVLVLSLSSLTVRSSFLSLTQWLYPIHGLILLSAAILLDWKGGNSPCGANASSR